MAAWWEEVFSTLLSATRYLQCQPELWVATYEGILWPKLGSGAGAVTQSSVLGLWMCSCNFSAVAPTQESWAAPGLQGPSSFPFLDCVIFPPLQWFRREGLIFPENYSHYVAIRSDHSLWGSSRWTLPAHAPPKRASHHSSLSFFFRLVLIVSQPFQDSEKERKDCIFNRNWLYLCLFFFYKPHMADRAFVYVADYCKQSPAFLPLCGNGCLKLCKGTSPVNPRSSSRHGLTWRYLFRC